MEVAEFLFPQDLQCTPSNIKKVLLVGSCLSEFYKNKWAAIAPDTEFEFCIFNNASDLPDRTHELADVDFQYLQLPLRSILTDLIVKSEILSNSSSMADVYSNAIAILDAMIDSALKYNRGSQLLTIVANFIEPQLPVATSLVGHGSGSDLSEIVRRLNAHLRKRLASETNVYIADVNALASSLGKRYFLDDAIVFYSHGSLFFSDWVEMEAHPSWTAPLPGRIEPIPTMSSFYENRNDEFFLATYRQAQAIFRTVNQIDIVKAVIFDLDNTLWRGQIAEHYQGELKPYFDGWPLGIWEAVQHLKARGILVAIVSKNDEDVVRRYWDTAVGEKWISLDDFFPVIINWNPKAEGVSEILSTLSLTDRSVVFVDDNPVEREAVKAAHPNIRTLGANPFTIRRILLWSAETQVVSLTAESQQRDQMIRRQHERETARAAIPRAEFLAQLGAEIALTSIAQTSDPAYPRAFELLNKTNQFNTTGRRWSGQELSEFFATGGQLFAFNVQDKFTAYGLVGLLLCRRETIEQMVMSCRVLGMDVELAAIAAVVQELRKIYGQIEIEASVSETPSNTVCLDVFRRSEFFTVAGSENTVLRYVLPAHLAPMGADHVRVTMASPAIA